ncbi:MAG: hypothetical protein QOF99_8194, partial [Pseudonocardiales bacterium]|nr:hypothetical protein [Pseudonocardiales bacterium]
MQQARVETSLELTGEQAAAIRDLV